MDNPACLSLAWAQVAAVGCGADAMLWRRWESGLPSVMMHLIRGAADCWLGPRKKSQLWLLQLLASLPACTGPEVDHETRSTSCADDRRCPRDIPCSQNPSRRKPKEGPTDQPAAVSPILHKRHTNCVKQQTDEVVVTSCLCGVVHTFSNAKHHVRSVWDLLQLDMVLDATTE